MRTSGTAARQIHTWTNARRRQSWKPSLQLPETKVTETHKTQPQQQLHHDTPQAHDSAPTYSMYSHNAFMKMPTVEMQEEGKSLSFLGHSGATHSVPLISDIKRADVPNCKSRGHFIYSVGASGV